MQRAVHSMCLWDVLNPSHPCGSFLFHCIVQSKGSNPSLIINPTHFFSGALLLLSLHSERGRNCTLCSRSITNHSFNASQRMHIVLDRHSDHNYLTSLTIASTLLNKCTVLERHSDHNYLTILRFQNEFCSLCIQPHTHQHVNEFCTRHTHNHWLSSFTGSTIPEPKRCHPYPEPSKLHLSPHLCTGCLIFNYYPLIVS